MKLIICGNNMQFLQFRKDNSLNKNALYINNPIQLRGRDIKRENIIITGEPWLNPHYNKIMEELNIRLKLNGYKPMVY